MWPRRTKTFFNFLNPPPPDPLPTCDDLPTVADMGLGGKLRGRGDTTTLPGTLPVTPGAGDGGYGSGSSFGNPPPEVTPGTGPTARQEGVYTPTAQAGAPG